MSILQSISVLLFKWAGSVGLTLWVYGWIAVKVDEARDRARARKQQRTASTGFFITQDEIIAETKIPGWLVRFVLNIEAVRKKLAAAR